jgi:hypothetical protein
MTEYQSISGKENGGYGLFTRAVSINSGAFAFLMVPPTPPGLESIVEVVHCTKEFVLPMGQRSASRSDSAVDQAIIFVGETQLQQLPKIFMQPSGGLDEATTPADTFVPSTLTEHTM